MRLIRLFKRDLRAEIADWVAEELLSEQQAKAICARYGVDYHDNPSSFGYHLLMALGYLFVGLSLILLIGGNWEHIPRELRMGGLLLLTMATQALAVRQYANRYEKAALGIFFLGNLFFGASIILIAQTYHLGEHMPDGIYWWALGTLPLAVLTRNAWLMMQTLLLAGIWYLLEFMDGYSTGSAVLFLAAAVYVLLGAARSLILFFMVIIGGALVFETTLWQWLDGDTLPDRDRYLAAISMPVSAAIMLAYWALSQWLHTRQSTRAQDYGALLELWSLRFGLVFVFVASFAFFWEELFYWHNAHALITTSFITLLAMAALLGVAAKRQLITLSVIAVVAGIFSLPAFFIHPQMPVAAQIVVNLIAILAGVCLIIRGLSIGKSQYYFLGIILILGIGLLRYFDLIGSYLGGALLFGFFAAVLLASASYWKHRTTAA